MGSSPPTRRALLGGLASLGVASLVGGCAEADPAAYAPDPLPPHWIVVRLPTDGDGDIALGGAWQALDVAGDERVRGLEGRLPVRVDAGQLVLAGLPTGRGTVDLRPLKGADLSVAGRRYRGSLRVHAHPEGLRLYNRLPVDDYLRGVVPGEMPDRFGLAALSAQTVAARTYALAEMRSRTWLHADVRSQVYSGRDGESWLGDRAVEATRGQVLTAEGRVFPAWFHSTCGGATVPARNVFPAAPEAVLREARACDDCAGSPTWSWTRRLEAELVCAAVGLPPAPLESVEGLSAQWPGRPAVVRVRAGGRAVEVPGEQFRRDVSAGQPQERRLLSTRWAAPAALDDGRLVIQGHGWGHGVGLCQYGAAGRARRGEGYAAILAHYYDGARLVQLDDPT